MKKRPLITSAHLRSPAAFEGASKCYLRALHRISANALSSVGIATVALAGVILISTVSVADPLRFASLPQSDGLNQLLPEAEPDGTLPSDAKIAPHLRREIVAYSTGEAAGTVIIDTPHTYLYYVLGDRRAIRYGIGVGREGFTWAGTQKITRKQEWPDWYPPVEMIERQPYLPRMMAGGPGNPLGARAVYLGNTMYRIHGTNAPETIGTRVSSGCIRMLNERYHTISTNT